MSYFLRERFSRISGHGIGNRACFYHQNDLSYDFHCGVFASVARTIEKEVAYLTKFCENLFINGFFSCTGKNYMILDFVFFTGKFPELTCQHRFGIKLPQNFFIVYILIVLFDAEDGYFTGAKTGFEQRGSAVCGERLAVKFVGCVCYFVCFPILVIDFGTPAHHIHRIVIEQR